jgi:hypothetical protein
MDDLRSLAPFIIPIVAIVGWFVYAIVHSMHRTRIRELEIRERIAMIEKGMMPRPEVDPRGFDRAMYRHDRLMRMTAGNAGRHRRAGIVLIGIGVGLIFLIGFYGNPEEGFGVGGFLCILGLAFLINSFFELRHQPPPPANGSTANHKS